MVVFILSTLALASQLPPLTMWVPKDATCVVASSPLQPGCTLTSVPHVPAFRGSCGATSHLYFLDEKACLAALPAPAAKLSDHERAAGEALAGCLGSVGTNTVVDAAMVPQATMLLQICACTAPGIADISRNNGTESDVAKVSVACMRRAGFDVSAEAAAAAEEQVKAIAAQPQLPPADVFGQNGKKKKKKKTDPPKKTTPSAP